MYRINIVKLHLKDLCYNVISRHLYHSILRRHLFPDVRIYDMGLMELADDLEGRLVKHSVVAEMGGLAVSSVRPSTSALSTSSKRLPLWFFARHPVRIMKHELVSVFEWPIHSVFVLIARTT